MVASIVTVFASASIAPKNRRLREAGWARMLAVSLGVSTLFLSPRALAARQPVTLKTLLLEMIDRDATARFPDPDFRLVSNSSYNRASVTPGKPGWFANHDSGFFLRTENHSGRKEWVIFEQHGPGAIVRWWMPDRRIKPNKRVEPETAVVRIYFDGSDQPAIVGPALDLFNGTGFIKPPLAGKSLSSAVSYLPIPYARGCKITLDQVPYYYIITARRYADGTAVRTFTKAAFDADRPVVERVSNALLHPGVGELLHRSRWSGVIPMHGTHTLELPAGTAAVREITVKLAPDANPQLTRSLVLAATFDGRQTIWSPVGDFFGTGVGINPFSDWTRTVAADGTMTCRWVMPYRRSATVTLINLDSQPASVALAVGTGNWSWDHRSLYFHATWRHQYPVPTRPRSDWSFLTLRGRAVYVGDTLTVVNPERTWWGEGDAKTFVDGEKFPSLFGTGTEDYYGYSWGGNNTYFYQHPFHSQVRAHCYNQLHRRPAGAKRNDQGYSTETRIRSLDTIVCQSSLRHYLEVWHKLSCDMEYNVCTYWYAPATTTSQRQPDPQAAAAPLRFTNWLKFDPD